MNTGKNDADARSIEPDWKSGKSSCPERRRFHLEEMRTDIAQVLHTVVLTERSPAKAQEALRKDVEQYGAERKNLGDTDSISAAAMHAFVNALQPLVEIMDVKPVLEKARETIGLLREWNGVDPEPQFDWEAAASTVEKGAGHANGDGEAWRRAFQELQQTAAKIRAEKIASETR